MTSNRNLAETDVVSNINNKLVFNKVVVVVGYKLDSIGYEQRSEALKTACVPIIKNGQVL